MAKEFDYYSILNVPRTATSDEITLAYRKLASMNHPKRIPDIQDEFNKDIDEKSHLLQMSTCGQWEIINKAYDILSDPLRREVYNRFGEAGLSRGIALQNLTFKPYTYHGDFIKTYEEVFGTCSPYANIIESITNPPPLYSHKNGIALKRKEKPIEKILLMSLNDVYYGTMKRMKIFREEFIDSENVKTEQKQKVLTIHLLPGTLADTKITFREEGDRGPGLIPADITFITVDMENNYFRRDKANLHVNHEISLYEALCGFSYTLRTLDDRKIPMRITDVVYPGYTKEILGEGLPVLHDPKQYGSLIIHFNIKFPIYVPPSIKEELKLPFNNLKKYSK